VDDVTVVWSNDRPRPNRRYASADCPHCLAPTDRADIISYTDDMSPNAPPPPFEANLAVSSVTSDVTYADRQDAEALAEWIGADRRCSLAVSIFRRRYSDRNGSRQRSSEDGAGSRGCPERRLRDGN